MNSACVDLIYLDPPFNSKANYAAPIGSKAAGAAFKDTWTLADVNIAWLDLIEAKEPQPDRMALSYIIPTIYIHPDFNLRRRKAKSKCN